MKEINVFKESNLIAYHSTGTLLQVSQDCCRLSAYS